MYAFLTITVKVSFLTFQNVLRPKCISIQSNKLLSCWKINSTENSLHDNQLNVKINYSDSTRKKYSFVMLVMLFTIFFNFRSFGFLCQDDPIEVGFLKLFSPNRDLYFNVLLDLRSSSWGLYEDLPSMINKLILS